MVEKGGNSVDATRKTAIGEYSIFFQEQGLAVSTQDITLGIDAIERAISHHSDFFVEAHYKGYLHKLHTITVVLLPRHDRHVSNVFRTIGRHESDKGNTVVELKTKEQNGRTHYHHVPKKTQQF